jgi:uncharacterized protein YPO0396
MRKRMATTMRNETRVLHGFEEAAGQEKEQYRLTLVQLKDWGTFQDAHKMRVSPDGHLILGRSGSGKTTLLDAHATLIAPKMWLDYNAAARETGERKKDRTVVGYLRGAFNSGISEKELTTEFLRKPNTWSIIAETYENGMGASLTLAVVLWVKGENASEVRRYFIAPRFLDIQELGFIGEVLGESDSETRAIRRRLAPDIQMFDDYSSYGSRLRTVFAIDDEQAVKLLVRTMSARNVGDLNEFIRENMLDPPETIALAKAAARGCQELFDARAAIALASRQIAALAPVRARDEERRREQRLVSDLSSELLYFDGFANAVLTELYTDELKDAEAKLAKTESVHRGTQELLDDKRRFRETVVSEIELKGGKALNELERERDAAIQERNSRHRARTQIESLCSAVEVGLPSMAASFHELQQAMAEKAARLMPKGAEYEKLFSRHIECRERRGKLEARIRDLREEIANYESRIGNIEPSLVRVREVICSALGLESASLPFAGELIQVLPEEHAWRHSIELAFRNLSSTLLVSEQDHKRVAAYLDSTSTGKKIAYLRMTNHPGNDHRLSGEEHHVVSKLELKSCAQESWLRGWIMDRLPYICVEDMEELHLAEKAITRAGLIKENRYLHVKDDRPFGQGQWSLGFSNTEKVDFLKNGLQELAVEYEESQRQTDEAEDDLEKAVELSSSCTKIAEAEWERIDVAEIARMIDELSSRIEVFRREHIDLATLKEHEQKLKAEIHELETRSGHESEEIGALKSKIEEISQRISGYRNSDALADADMSNRIRERIGASDNAEKLLRLGGVKDRESSLQGIRQKVYNDPIATARKNVEVASTDIVNKLEAFKNAAENAVLASDITGSTIDRVDDYLAILETLEREALPSAQERFRRHMREQARNNFLMLAQRLRHDETEISDRLESVNKVLRQSIYDRHAGSTTYVLIADANRNLAEVDEFYQDIKSATTNTLVPDDTSDEVQFEIIAKLVKRIESEEPADRRWRDLVLDVREHKEFRVYEYVRGQSGAADAMIQAFQGGAGKSGGQRQKLAATCLAAALRYQLGGEDMRLPLFSTIVIDEAFSKTDSEYTDTILATFKNFGFQMILSTPLKTINACMKHIRGATMVSIANRNRSQLDDIPYDIERKRLDVPGMPSPADGASR